MDAWLRLSKFGVVLRWTPVTCFCLLSRQFWRSLSWPLKYPDVRFGNHLSFMALCQCDHRPFRKLRVHPEVQLSGLWQQKLATIMQSNQMAMLHSCDSTISCRGTGFGFLHAHLPGLLFHRLIEVLLKISDTFKALAIGDLQVTEQELGANIDDSTVFPLNTPRSAKSRMDQGSVIQPHPPSQVESRES